MIPGVVVLVVALFGDVSRVSAQDADAGADKKNSKKKPPAEVAGKADVLRHVKKRFAAFQSWDSKGGRIQLAIEGDEEPSSWPVLADAEIKIRGWWGRIEQLRAGDRVWVWFFVDQNKKPVSVLMLADEISEQDIHDHPHRIDSVEGKVVTVSVPGAKEKAPVRELEVAAAGNGLNQGAEVFLQTAEGAILEALSEEEFSEVRRKQQDWLRDRWRAKGLPGTMVFLHPLSGEMDVMLDHEAMRWGRYLKNGDSVSIGLGDSSSKVKAQVKSVEPWRERTRIRLATNSGLDQVAWSPGQRLGLIVPEPPAEVQASSLPTDIGRRTVTAERVEWFLQTMYCTCGISGDRCTGMFYTLSSCNVNACGGPKEWRGVLAEQIGAGKSDREIFEQFRESRGRDFWRPHLLR